jgi:hypothetical protein
MGSEELSSAANGAIYAEGVTARRPGLQCETSYPGSGSVCKVPYPNGVIADRQRFGNNAFSVEKTGGHLHPG